VFFDFGGTLFRYSDLREDFDAMLESIARGHGIGAPRQDLRRVYRETMGEAFRAFHPRPFYLHRELFAAAHASFLDRLGARPGHAPGDELYERQSRLGLARVEPRAEAEETLAALRALGLHLGIVSNIDEDQFHPLFERIGLARHFDATTTSEEARSCKPHPGIFRVALAKAGAPAPETVLFVGDSIEHDVAGANALGMTSVLVARRPPGPGAVVPHHVIGDLRELLEIAKA
jgi:2-haloalkanoic acid dehalogenase type II